MQARGATVTRMQASTSPVTPESDRLAFSIDEVAARLGVTKRHVFRLIERGELRRVKTGRRVLVLAEDLTSFIDDLKARAA